jgi:hypothetical protein
MDKPGMFVRVLLVAGAAAVCYASLQFYLGYSDRGTAYPRHSTLRSDPLGARALYGALERVEGMTVSRNLLPLLAYTPPPGAALVLHGAQVSADPLYVIERLETWLAAGGRLVITHAPYRDGMLPWDSFEAVEEERAEHGGGKPSEEAEQEDQSRTDEDGGAEPVVADANDAESPEETARKALAENVDGVWIDERWGFRYDYAEVEAPHGEAVPVEEQAGFPATVAWWSGLYFAEPDANWTVRYTREDLPVIIERSWGQGSIVLCSDTYFLSNEAMKDARHPALLAWLIGRTNTIVFDESHLGVVQSPGIADLVRRFRFEGVLLAFLVSGLLLAWHGMSSLLPRRDRGGEDERAERGREMTAGLEALLKRSVPRSRLLSQCVAEYEHTLEPGAPRRKRLERLRDLARHAESSGMTQDEVVHTYRRMRAILSEKD